MGLFNFKKQGSIIATNSTLSGTQGGENLAELALETVTVGVVIVDNKGIIKYANPAAATMTGYDSPASIVGLDCLLVIKLENAEGAPIPPEENKLAQAIRGNQAISTNDYLLVSASSGHRVAVALTCVPASGFNSDHIITFRDATKELEEVAAQTEFISTASHEMRTPVASIEGYLGLALNPQTATIDARARQYLESAHSASQHLGNLFKDLLDVTKLDDGRMRVHLVPVEIVSVVKKMAGEREHDVLAKHLKYSFGTTGPVNNGAQVEPLVYAAVDLEFLREILDNLIDNAIKYTPEGGEVWVNARADGDKVLINVTDTGIGVGADDLTHIFQKFYRVDNSQTRQIGGTGLGLYLVKQRVEALNGRVWCESAFGDGSTFFVSLPRLTDQEYERMRLAYDNSQMAQSLVSQQASAPQQAASSQQMVAPQPVQAVPQPSVPSQGVPPQMSQAPTTAQAPAMTQASAPSQQAPAVAQPVQSPAIASSSAQPVRSPVQPVASHPQLPSVPATAQPVQPPANANMTSPTSPPAGGIMNQNKESA